MNVKTKTLFEKKWKEKKRRREYASVWWNSLKFSHEKLSLKYKSNIYHKARTGTDFHFLYKNYICLLRVIRNSRLSGHIESGNSKNVSTIKNFFFHSAISIVIFGRKLLAMQILWKLYIQISLKISYSSILCEKCFMYMA